MQWKAIYDDSSSVMQYDEQGNKYDSLKLDRSRLARIQLLDGERLVAEVFLSPEKKLVYRKRTFMKMDGSQTYVHLLGYHITGNEPVILYIDDQTGETQLDGARNNLELLKEEI